MNSDGGRLADYDGSGITRGSTDDIIDIPCDIWVPAARPDVINADNLSRLNTRMVAQGAIIPITRDAEATLHQQGVLILPDFIANAGGVICAAMEYQGATQTAAFAAIEEKIQGNVATMFELVDSKGCLPREAAEEMALARVKAAMASRRWNIF